MHARLLARLRPYVLRSKVSFQDPERWALASISRSEAAAAVGAPPQLPGECVSSGDSSVLRWWGLDERYLLLAKRGTVAMRGSALQDLMWRRADITAGLPQVYPETHESFVAQMLNLDLLGAISFDKGCYAGQEIIARTHYRGSIKRRMFKFAAACAASLPGTRVLDGTERAGEVVDAVNTAPSAEPLGCELLAVVSLEHACARLSLDGLADSLMTRLALPYALSRPLP